MVADEREFFFSKKAKAFLFTHKWFFFLSLFFGREKHRLSFCLKINNNNSFQMRLSLFVCLFFCFVFIYTKRYRIRNFFYSLVVVSGWAWSHHERSLRLNSCGRSNYFTNSRLVVLPFTFNSLPSSSINQEFLYSAFEDQRHSKALEKKMKKTLIRYSFSGEYLLLKEVGQI